MPAKAPTILGTGLVALDLVVSADPTSPIKSWAGGTCGNVLSIMASLGWDSFPIARMNGDAASTRVKADFQRWGVRLDLVDCGPAVSTPIIVQEIRTAANGRATHRFSWSCLQCGGWLPSFKPVTRAAVERVRPHVPDASVFFFDRVSRAALDVAAQAAEEGAIVMFEPSGRGDEKQFKEALEIAHIVKYADQRMANLASNASGNLRLEIQTLGEAGLRFRLPKNRRNAEWRTMKAVSADTVIDACGSGDWCTAGLLAKLAPNGLAGLDQANVSAINGALRYGQELAAWNCAFEGARGGMYASELGGPSSLTQLRPAELSVPGAAPEAVTTPLIGCPKCHAA